MGKPLIDVLEECGLLSDDDVISRLISALEMNKANHLKQHQFKTDGQRLDERGIYTRYSKDVRDALEGMTDKSQYIRDAVLAALVRDGILKPETSESP